MDNDRNCICGRFLFFISRLYKHHRSLIPVGIFSVGLIFLIAKQFFAGLEITLLIPAVMLIISAHYFNYRLCQKSKYASLHHKH